MSGTHSRGTTPGMGEVELSLEQKSRATQGVKAEEQKPAILRKAFAVKQSFCVLLTLLTYVPVGK